MGEAHHHRATLKQSNKPFKSKHATKSSMRDAAKGRIQRTSPKATPAGSPAVAQLRQNRRNTAKQAQTKKRHALVSATRLFAGADGAPRVVAVVPLSPDVTSPTAATGIAVALGFTDETCPDASGSVWKIKADRFKTSLQLIPLSYGQLYAALDACKAADYVVFVLSPNVEVDTWGDTLLRTLQAQGLPSVIACVAPSPPGTPAKERAGVLKSLLSFVQYFSPETARVFDLGTDADKLNAARALCEGKPADVRWREGRPRLLAEDVKWTDGVLEVTGVVRGAPMSANRLVHIPDWGDYQVSKILSAAPPRHKKSGSMDVEPAVLAEPDPENADSLVSENDPDELAGEQTWPTEDDMRGTGLNINVDTPDAQAGTTPKAVRKIPKGMSEYQATWILDDDEEGTENGEEEEEKEGGAEKEEEIEEEEMVEIGVDEEMETDTRKSVVFQDMEEEEEEAQLEKWRSRKREEQDDLEFPDEIDTPRDIAARTRFQRYRGLRSFRTSPWDPYENLPRDYARIFQFEDFKRTEHAVNRRSEQDNYGVEPGTRVTVFIREVPQEASRSLPGAPFSIFGLMEHEHKQTVLNFAVQRNTEYDGSVRSKDPLVLCVGPRRFRTRPIYSELTRGGGKGANNVHKFERYLRHGDTHVATTFGPVVYGKQPCLLLRETESAQCPHLVAMGSFLNPDPTRIISKRIMLTGHPFKVHKKTATIRYMFFNRDDVAYFAPVQLSTKYGRTGHIREPLGTHGYFKAHFDGPINQMDTVCMALYKRVFPRWSELWTSRSAPVFSAAAAEADDDAMEE